jgi:uncharacterized membrane protein
MATLTVWRFGSPDGAQQAVETLKSLQAQELIRVHDSALVSWEEGKKKPRTRQQHDMVGAGALGGAFWGMLFGLIFLVPFLGAAIGAASGALAGMFSDVGIDDGFITRVREEVTPGTSALFVLSSDAVQDRVREAFTGQDIQLMHTNLSQEEEDRLRTFFAEE